MGLHERVIILENSLPYAIKLTEALEKERHTVVGHAGSIKDAFDLIDRANYTVAVVGTRLSRWGDGARAAEAIRHRRGDDAMVVAHAIEEERYGTVYVRKTQGKNSAANLARAVTDIPRP